LNFGLLDFHFQDSFPRLRKVERPNFPIFWKERLKAIEEGLTFLTDLNWLGGLGLFPGGLRRDIGDSRKAI